MLQAGPRSGVQRAGLTPLLPHCLLVTLGKSPIAALCSEFVSIRLCILRVQPSAWHRKAPKSLG